MKRLFFLGLMLLVGWVTIKDVHAQPRSEVVFRCPGNPVLYTDSISSKEAKARGCKTLEGAPVTIIQSNRPRASSGMTSTAVSSSNSNARVETSEQRMRDIDRKSILLAELRKEEEQLLVVQKEFNNGEPERRGDEKNYQKYIDRVAEMKAVISRKESDVAALKRELSKLP
jgi:hypothetical protein